MFDAVVEDYGFTDSPASMFETDTLGACLGHDQRQLHEQARVGFAMVRRIVGLRCQHRKHRGWAQAANIRHPDGGKCSGGFRAALKVVLDRLAILPNEIAAPAFRMAQLMPLIDGSARLTGEVGPKLSVLLRHQRREFHRDGLDTSLQCRNQGGRHHVRERNSLQSQHLQRAAHGRIRLGLSAQDRGSLAPAFGFRRNSHGY